LRSARCIHSGIAKSAKAILPVLLASRCSRD
jgi:hypothetical protein